MTQRARLAPVPEFATSITVADARKVLNDLETKLADNKAWQIEIETASGAVSFEAHVAGGEARERLDNLNAQGVAAKQEQASLEAAIAEGKHRLQLEAEAETDARERDQARMALGLVAGFVARGKALDEKLAAFLEEFQALRRDFHDLECTGYPPSNWRVLEINLRAAVEARFMNTPLQTVIYPPARRQSISHFVEGWGCSVRVRAQARLDRDGPVKDEAA